MHVNTALKVIMDVTSLHVITVRGSRAASAIPVLSLRKVGRHSTSETILPIVILDERKLELAPT